MRRFEFKEGTSSKFWEVDVSGKGFTVRWGKIGTAGQSQTKSFTSPTAAQAEHDKLVREKERKGYAEVGGAQAKSSSAAAAPKAAPAATKAGEPAAKAAGGFSGQGYVRRFTAMVEELRSDPEIRVLDFNVGAPVSTVDVAAVEKRLGTPLEPAIRSFYEAADGLQLRWVHVRRADPELDPKKAVPKKKWLKVDDVIADEGHANGLVNVLPLRETFIGANWEGTVWFDNTTNDDTETLGNEELPSLDFRKSLRIVDYFNNFYQAALFVRPGRGATPVLLGDDYGACWTDTKPCSFETYLELVLAERGLVSRRDEIMRSRHGARDAAYWRAHAPAFEALLKKLELRARAPTGGGEALLRRIKARSRSTVEGLCDETIRKAGVDKSAVVALLRTHVGGKDADYQKALAIAFRDLGILEDGDVPWLRAMLESEEFTGKWEAIRALGELAAGSAAAAQALGDVLAPRSGLAQRYALPYLAPAAVDPTPAARGILAWFSTELAAYEKEKSRRAIGAAGDIEYWIPELVLLARLGPLAAPARAGLERLAKDMGPPWVTDDEDRYGLDAAHRQTLWLLTTAALVGIEPSRAAPLAARVGELHRQIDDLQDPNGNNYYPAMGALLSILPALGAAAAPHVPKLVALLEDSIHKMSTRDYARDDYAAVFATNWRTLERLGTAGVDARRRVAALASKTSKANPELASKLAVARVG